MATRGAILRAGGVNEVPAGVYHHWDSYPSGLGATLFAAIRGHFNGDVDAALKLLIDDHPTGWSTILRADFSQEPGFYEYGGSRPCDLKRCGRPESEHRRRIEDKHGRFLSTKQDVLGHEYDRDWTKPDRPQCYCHGDRHEVWEGDPLTLITASGYGCEYAYVISPETRTMYVLSSYHEDGEKTIGMFGMGDADATWKELARVDLDGKEPDWGKIQGWPD